LIKLSNISKTFQKPDNVTVFHNLNLELANGDFTIVVGSNGSGKSTLLNLMAGTVKPDNGRIFLGNNDITRYVDYKRSKWIARIFQNPLAGTAPELTILENFRLASLRTKGKGFIIGTDNSFRTIVREKVSVLNLGLENKLDQKVGNLSGGQRQSLSLLMAIADDTQLLLLDEPTAALDPRTSELVMQIAEKVISSNKLTTLLVTHQLKHVIQYGNRIIHLKDGKIERDIRKDKNTKMSLAEVYGWFEE
jgi:putative tryptophan/tyrosine transport system ATP-binding protein